MTNPTPSSGRVLTADSVGDDPLTVVHAWFDDAVRTAPDGIDATAVALATTAAAGGALRPSCRMVLVKDIDIARGTITWGTNVASRKGYEATAAEAAAMTAWWSHQNRQVRLAGTVRAALPGVSDRIFDARPRASRISARASQQSTAIASRAELEQRWADADRHGDVTRPATWAALDLVVDEVELWQGRDHRLHDRIIFLRVDDAGRPVPSVRRAAEAAGGDDLLAAVGTVVTDDAGRRWVRFRAQP